MEDNKLRQGSRSSPSLNPGVKLILIFHVLWTISLSVLVIYNHVQNEVRFVELENQVKACITTDATPKSFRFNEEQATSSTTSDEKTYSVYRRSVSDNENSTENVLIGKTPSNSSNLDDSRYNNETSERPVPSTNGPTERRVPSTSGPTERRVPFTSKTTERRVPSTSGPTKRRVPSTSGPTERRLPSTSGPKKEGGKPKDPPKHNFTGEYGDDRRNRSKEYDAMYCLELLRSIVQGDRRSNSSVCDMLRGPPGKPGPHGTPGKTGPQGMIGPRGEKGDSSHSAGDQKDEGKSANTAGCSGTMLAPPLFLETSKKYISREEVTSEMTCKTTANPSADISWYKDDVILTGERYVIHQRVITSQVPRQIQRMCPSKVPHPITQSTLVIKRSRGADTGTYVCKARNMMGTREYNMDLTVRVPVRFTTVPSNITVLQEDSVRLNCSASGIPDAKITWYRKNGRKMPVNHRVAGGDLIISNITKAQEGMFVCVATNVLGSKSTEASLTVNIFPKVTSFLEMPLTINEHHTAVLPCSATGFPTPSISWRKLEGFLVHNRSTYDDNTLVIRDVDYGDRGEYICTANNSVGTVDRTATVIVQVAPRIIRRPKTVEFGYHTTRKVLELEVFGFPPPNITWSGPALRHVTGRTHQSNGSLVIMRTEYMDSGPYQAVIRNVVGEKWIATFLVVAQGVPPGIVVKLKPRVSLSVGKKLSLTCSAVGKPTPDIAWYHSGSLLTSGVTGRTNNKTLTIISLGVRHNGRYACIARNMFGFDRHETFVVVDQRGLSRSSILSTCRNCIGYVETLNRFLDPVLKHKDSRWIRCWGARDDGWSSYTFHSRCDNKGPTVTIVQVAGKYVFGGYTDISWGRYGGYAGTSSSKSFLYSLYNKRGFYPIKLVLTRYTNHAIYRNSGNGPTFGGGHDLYIANDAGNNQISFTYTSSTHSYQIPPGCSRFNQCSFFAGTSNFTPGDVEVFYETTNN